jgi:hypothetical protein
VRSNQWFSPNSPVSFEFATSIEIEAWVSLPCSYEYASGEEAYAVLSFGTLFSCQGAQTSPPDTRPTLRAFSGQWFKVPLSGVPTKPRCFCARSPLRQRLTAALAAVNP